MAVSYHSWDVRCGLGLVIVQLEKTGEAYEAYTGRQSDYF